MEEECGEEEKKAPGEGKVMKESNLLKQIENNIKVIKSQVPPDNIGHKTDRADYDVQPGGTPPCCVCVPHITRTVKKK